jgi:hypothetical protein
VEISTNTKLVLSAAHIKEQKHNIQHAVILRAGGRHFPTVEKPFNT